MFLFDTRTYRPRKKPPSSREESDEAKEPYQRQAKRPHCGHCHMLMTASSTDHVSTYYPCKNEDCPNIRGIPVTRREDVELIKDHSRIQQQSVAARENMKDTSDK